MQTTKKETGTTPPLFSLIEPGTAAPDFSLPTGEEDSVRLEDLRGRPVILAFYPADWSPVCGDELALFNEVLPEFQRYGAQLLGISVDNVWSHKAYSDSRNLHFPLLSDFHPKGAVGRLYGVYDETIGEDQRSLFVIDREGIVRWSFLAETWKNPGAAGVLKALRALPAASDGKE